MKDDPDPPRVRYSFKPTRHESLSEEDKLKHPKPIDVRQILRDNTAAGGKPPPDSRPAARWRSRRRRDCLLLLAIPNLVIAAVLFLAPRHELALVLGISAMALYSLAVAWLMWGVMGDD